MIPVLPPSPAKVEVPRSFELYVDGAKWLLAIISGLLVYGFAALKDHPGDDRTLALFASSAVCLGIAAVCALYYLLMSFTVLSRRETGYPTSDELVKRPKRQSNLAFIAMLWTFAAGLLFFVLFGASQLMVLRTGNGSLQVHAGAYTSVLVQRGDRLWTLTRMSDGQEKWQPLPLISDENIARLPQPRARHTPSVKRIDPSPKP